MNGLMVDPGSYESPTAASARFLALNPGPSGGDDG